MSDRRRDDDFDMSGADAPMGASDWGGNEGGTSALVVPEGTPTFRVKSKDTYLFDFHKWKAGAHNPNRPEGDWTSELIYYEHPYIGPAGARFLCPLKQGNRPCAVCDFAADLRRRMPDGEEKKKAMSDLKPKAQGAYQVTFPAKNEWNPHVFRHSAWNFSEKFKAWFAAMHQMNPEVAYFASPNRGMTVAISFEKSAKYDTAYVAVPLSFQPRNYAYDRETLSKCLRLEDHLVWPDYDAVAAAIGGGKAPDTLPSRTSYSQGVQAPAVPPRQPGPPRSAQPGHSSQGPSGPPRSGGPQPQPSVPSGPPKGPPRAQQHTPDTDEHDERGDEQAPDTVPAHVADALHPQPGYRFWFKVGDDDQPVSVEVLKVRPDGMCSCEDEDGNPLRIHADVIANLQPDTGVPPAAPEPERAIEPVLNVAPSRRNRKVS